MEEGVGTTVLTVAFGLAVVLGAVASRTHFCTMGAVSDWVNMGDTGRFRAWVLAMAVALLGVLGLEALQMVDLDESRIPYRGPNFAWARYVLGGVLFGIGMSLAGGCANKNLVRVGGGNAKSIIVLLVMGAFAYLMTRTDFYGVVFLSWMAPLTPDLNDAIGADGQDVGRVVGALVGAEDPSTVRVGIGAVLVVAMLAWAFRSAEFRRNLDQVVGGIVIGALVVAAWYLTGGPTGQEWMEAAEFADRPPEGVGVQSFTFVNPIADTMAWAMQAGDLDYVTFGVVALFGVITGSAVYSVISRTFRFEWFASFADVVRNVIGAALMGIGGVLALGCTVGQGITGLSTLALGSVLALVSIVIASALTMKVEYYRMLHEDAGFGAAFITGLVDLRLLPSGMRRLEDL